MFDNTIFLLNILLLTSSTPSVGKVQKNVEKKNERAISLQTDVHCFHHFS